MAIVTARAKPRQGWSTSLRNDDDNDDSDDDGSSSPSAAAPPPARQGSDWDWNWSSELIDIGLVDEPDQLRFVETPFTLAKRNALANSNRASTETQTIANKKTKKKLATTPAASASANKSKPTAATTTTTTPAPPLRPATLNKTKKKQNSLAAEAKQQAAPPVISEPPSPSSKNPLCSPPIPQQQSHEDATSSKARLISSSRFRPASTSSPTVFSSLSSSQPASSSTAADKPLLATATATTETETEHAEKEQAAPVSAHRRLAAAVGLATTKSSATRHEQSSAVATPNLSSADRLHAVASSYSEGTTGQDPRVLIPKEVTMTGSSSSKQASASTKDDADGAESPCPLPRRRGREEPLGGPSAPNINQLKRDAARPPFSNLPFVSPLMKRQQLDRHKMQRFRGEEAGEGDGRRLTFASSSARSQSVNADLLPRTQQVPHSHAQNVQGGQGQAPTSSSTAAAAVSSSTPSSSAMTTMTTTHSLPLRHRHEGISPETRKRLDRFKRVGNFSASSSSALANASAAAAKVETDPGRLLRLCRRGDDDGPSLEPSTPMPDRSAFQSGGPGNDDSAPRSSIRKVSTKFSLPGFGTAEGSSSSSSLQIKKKRSRLDFTPDEPLEVFRQKKNAHGPSSSSSPSANGWDDVEPVSPSPLFPTGGPFQQQQRRHQEELQQQLPRRETIVLGAAVRSVRPVSLATAAAAATTGNNNNNNKLGTSSSSSLSSSLSLPKRQTGGFKRPLAAARTRPNFIIRGDDADDDDYQGGAARDEGRRESEDAKRRRLYRSLGL